uniref:Uncharacterized protein n=1 Tax=Ascaris lumbricoides TaxID=6252 RepID=A0A9J2PPS2_ASCLU
RQRLKSKFLSDEFHQEKIIERPHVVEDNIIINWLRYTCKKYSSIKTHHLWQSVRFNSCFPKTINTFPSSNDQYPLPSLKVPGITGWYPTSYPYVPFLYRITADCCQQMVIRTNKNNKRAIRARRLQSLREQKGDKVLKAGRVGEGQPRVTKQH